MSAATEPTVDGYYWILEEGDDAWVIIERLTLTGRGSRFSPNYYYTGSEVDYAWEDLCATAVLGPIQPPGKP